MNERDCRVNSGKCPVWKTENGCYSGAKGEDLIPGIFKKRVDLVKIAHMRKRFFTLWFALAVFSIANRSDAETLPFAPHLLKSDWAAIHVPPPVEQAFQAMLLEVAQDYHFHLSDITQLTTTWTREKNVYTVTARFGLSGCDDTNPFNMLTAKFKANGEVVPIPGVKGEPLRYVFDPVECIRAPF